jgi:ribosomal protein S27AE
MAVVKLSYTRRRGAVKAHLRYITHRPGKDNERTTRVLFGRDGKMTKDQAYALIDAARRGTVFFRIMLSPDPRSEDRFKDLNLRELTEDALLYLQKQLQKEIHFIAAEHADHRPHRHVHLVALIQGKLTKEDIQALRSFVTDSARQQRQELDLTRAASREAVFAQPAGAAPVGARVRPLHASMQVYPQAPQGTRASRPLNLAPTCPSCGDWQPMTKLPVENRYACARCGLRMTTKRAGVQVPSQEAGWGV